ncbi:MAG: heavy metal-associated domain-containing protein [Phycisphaerales bacterium]
MNAFARSAVLLALASITTLAACASNQTASGGAGTPTGENAVTHVTTQADADRLNDTNAIASNRVRLYVNGMGCPQCVSNIDLQLGKIRGVKSSKVNLGDGTVDVELYAKDHPSPAQIHKAVGGDFTLVKLEELK